MTIGVIDNPVSKLVRLQGTGFPAFAPAGTNELLVGIAKDRSPKPFGSRRNQVDSAHSAVRSGTYSVPSPRGLMLSTFREHYRRTLFCVHSCLANGRCSGLGSTICEEVDRRISKDAKRELEIVGKHCPIDRK